MGKTKKSWKERAWQWRGVWVTTPAITALVILIRTAGLLQGWEWAAYDQFLRLRPREQPDDRIVIVGLTEEDYRRQGQLVFPDGVYAELLEKLKEQEPRAIGLDIYRPRPIEPGHEDLIRVFESTPNLVGIQKVSGDSERETVDPPPTLQANQIGANDTLIDADNKVRRGLLTVANAQNPDAWVPSFGMNLAARYLAPEGINIEIAEGTDNWWQLGDVVLRDIGTNEGGYIRTETGDYQILLNYRSHPVAFDQVSLTDVLEDKIPSDWATDRIVLIGAVADSANDVFFTPYSAGLLELPQAMPGVEIHAHLISKIISAVLDDRPTIRSWPEYWEWGWVFLWSGVAASIAWTLRQVGTDRVEAAKRAILIVLSIVVLLGASYGALIWGWWIPIVPPLLGVVGATAAIVAYIARSAGDIRKTFGRYLTDEVVANLLENPEGLKMGGERRKITILTSDLRGFTAISERLPPEQVVKILNFYLGYMADVITRYQGTIDEFMGDGILVLFGAPTVREDDPRRAIACAVAMQQAMTEVNTQMRAWKMPELEMGIGINTGEVVVGNIGSEKRTKYGVVGSQVNLTYRIESYTTGGQILVPEATLKEAGAHICIGGQKEVSPKGVTKPITIYEIEGIGGEYQLYLEKEEEVFFTLTQPLLLQYTVLEGKHIGSEATKAKLLRLSNKGGEIQVESNGSLEKPTPLQNIKLNFLDLFNTKGAGNETGNETEISEDVYAKVIEKESTESNFYVKFTAKPPNVNQKLQEIYQTIEG